ncbi:MAG: tetratricopeptide repeat protein [Cyanobacteria bacterium J06639_18]
MYSQSSEQNNQLFAQIITEEIPIQQLSGSGGFNWIVYEENEGNEENEGDENAIDSEAKDAYEQGEEYTNKDLLDEAIAEYTKAIELKPNYAEAYYRRSVILSFNYAEKALEDARKAKQLFIEEGDQFSAQAMESHIQIIQAGMQEGELKNNPF